MYYQKYSLQLVKEKSIEDEYDYKIDSSSDVYKFLKDVCHLHLQNREHFMALSIAADGSIIGFNTVSIGDLSSAQVHPREILKFAIISNAAGIVIAHNRPSPNCCPSDEDIKTTIRINEACNIMGIKLLDHIIVCQDDFKSLRAMEAY